MMRIFIGVTVLMLLLSGCNKEDDIFIEVNFPIANVGDGITFTVKNAEGVTGVRWNMGDGSGSVNQNVIRYYVYNSPGTYTVTALVFSGQDSKEVTTTVTIEGNPINPNPQPNRKGIRLKKVQIVQDDYGATDPEYDPTTPAYNPDLYFTVDLVGSQSQVTNLYARSQVRYNIKLPTWTLDANFPVAYYEDYERIIIYFYDDDASEGSADDYSGQVDIYTSAIVSYESTKPGSVQIPGIGGLVINLELEWLE